MSDVTTPTPQDHPPDELESEVLTFLIADVRDYTRFTQEFGDEAAARLAGKFADVTRRVVSERRGQVIELRGDEALAVFSSARQALRAASQLQSAYAQETEDDPQLPLRVGIGIDAGEAVEVEGGYRGGALNLAARLCGVAATGDILASETVVALARRIDGLSYVSRGPVQLKGFAEPVSVVQVTSAEGGQARPTELHPPATRAIEQSMPLGGFLGAAPESRLVAREDELAVMTRALDDAESGRGQVVLLVGEPGVGKTRLAQEVSVLALQRGFIIATAGCYEQRQTLPFYPFTQVLAKLYASAPQSIRDEIPRSWPQVARLLPDSGLEAPPPTSGGIEEQERLFGAVTGFLQALAAVSPVALLMDDLQWADGASLELFEHLARRLRANRVFLLAAYRDFDLTQHQDLQTLLLSLSRQQLAGTTAVRPLGHEQTATFIASALGSEGVPAQLVDLLHRRTGGNPFFLGEVLQTLVERGDVYRQNGSWAVRDLRDIKVPGRVRVVIGHRLSGLDEQTRAIIHHASVLGQTFSFDTLLTVSGRPEDEIERALEEARRADVVRELSGDQYVFSHPLIRQTLYEDLSARRRKRLHLAAGEALEHVPERERRSRAAELAWHFLQADDAGKALAYEVLAGDEAESIFAHSEAVRHYEAALDVAPLVRDAAMEAEILEKLGTVLTVMGRYDQSLEVLERAIQIYDGRKDLEAERRTAAQIGLAQARAGRPELGLERLQPILEAARGASPSRGMVLLFAAQSQLLAAAGQYPESLDAATRAAVLSRGMDDDDIRAEAEVKRGEALAMVGRLEEARKVLEDAVPLAEKTNPSLLTRALTVVGLAAVLSGRFDEAKLILARALEQAERADDPLALASASFAQGNVYLVGGDWDKARQSYERSRSYASALESRSAVARRSVMLTYLSLLEGKPGAGSQLDTLIAQAERDGDERTRQFASVARAEADLVDGQPEAARDRLEAIVPHIYSSHPDTTQFLLSLARAYALCGNLQEAERVVDRAMVRIREERSRIGFVDGLFARGVLRRRQGRWTEATNLYEAALHLAREMGYPLRMGRTLYEAGLVDIRLGDLSGARSRLREAADIFERLGALKDRALVEGALSSLGEAGVEARSS